MFCFALGAGGTPISAGGTGGRPAVIGSVSAGRLNGFHHCASALPAVARLIPNTTALANTIAAGPKAVGLMRLLMVPMARSDREAGIPRQCQCYGSIWFPSPAKIGLPDKGVTL